MTELMAMFVGICAAIVMGIVHHYALSGILKFSPQRSDGSGFRIILTFSALLLLHVLELVTLAVVALPFNLRRDAFGDNFCP
ncbi:hypothetical protein SM764_18345 [Pseudophaeobacter sp. 1A16562]|uniref:hypothetical protein n=1 Tax=Pseudophaeobacter sp. 1A16562 TaxID=3098143 RepID=UPI0034D6E64E